ncbi:MAG TPA: TIGR04282 family arsenosugar biosynthesis glycosyltransferase [Flavisolibacter sp.]
MSKAIIIFVRNPERGKVKTRLAATLGDDKALEIYLQLLDHTAAITKSLQDVSRYVFYSDSIGQNDPWSEGSFYKMIQSDGDLGRKMFAAFQAVFSRGHNKVVIIGSDCPGLTSGGLMSAFESLSRQDVVIGPANDGGYYLLGLKELNEMFFTNKEWSTDGVYKATLENIHSLHLSCYCLPPLVDVDTEEDWNLARRAGFI